MYAGRPSLHGPAEVEQDSLLLHLLPPYPRTEEDLHPVLELDQGTFGHGLVEHLLNGLPHLFLGMQ